MSETSIYARLARILLPPLLCLLVSWGLALLFPGADISLQAVMTAVCTLPFLAVWYARDRKQETCSGAERGENKGRHAPPLALPAACLLCLVSGAVLSAVSAQLMRLLGMYGRFSNAAQEAYQASPAIWLILGPGLLAPLYEELLYRGLLYGRLKREMTGAAAALASSLAFAAGHGNVIQFLYAFPMGILLCRVSEAFGGNILLPVMMHLGANLYSVVRTLPGR